MRLQVPARRSPATFLLQFPRQGLQQTQQQQQTAALVRQLQKQLSSKCLCAQTCINTDVCLKVELPVGEVCSLCKRCHTYVEVVHLRTAGSPPSSDDTSILVQWVPRVLLVSSRARAPGLVAQSRFSPLTSVVLLQAQSRGSQHLVPASDRCLRERADCSLLLHEIWAFFCISVE